MKFGIPLIALFFILMETSYSFAQTPPKIKDFKSVQREFNAWKSSINISEKKHWKPFKRWEQEMQLHVNGHGEPEGADSYLKALCDNAGLKNNDAARGNAIGTWYPAGPFNLPDNLTGYMENGMGRVNCTAFHPTDSNTWYVGFAQGGLWKTSNNGQSYTPLTDQLPITRISDIAIDPSNPNTIYISLCDFEYIGFGLFLNGRKRHTHYGLGVYKSTDGGNNWVATGLSFQLTDGDGSLIRKIIIDPSNTNHLLAAGVSGMYRSVDGGQTWTQPLDSLFWDMIQDPVSPHTIYAATGWVKNSNSGYAGIYKSTDFGITWSMLTTGIPQQGVVQRVKLAQSPSQPSRIYALTVDINSGLHQIYKSSDAGVTWTTTLNSLNLLEYYDGQGSGGQGNYDLGFLVDPLDPDKVYVGGINLWASSDAADTFDPAGYWLNSYGPSIHADIHELRYNPTNSSFYLSCDGGLYKTHEIIPVGWSFLQNGGTFPTQWVNLSNGMNTTSFYRLSSSRNASGELVAGSQDNATFYFDGNSWFTVFGGDGMDNCMDTTQFGSFVASSQYGNFGITTDGGISFGNFNPNINGENAEWTTPLIPIPGQAQSYMAAYENVVKSTDNGNTWNVISGFPPAGTYGSELSSIAVSAANTDVIYAARRVRYEYNQPGAIFRSANGGISWSDITAGLPDTAFYTWIEADPDDPQRAYLGLAGLINGQKVYQTIDAGQSWTNISYNLPNVPVNCLRVIPGTGTILAGTDAGVWKLEAGSNQWNVAGSGLPNIIVSDIEFNTTLNKIYISTFGRGIWATDLNTITGNIQNPDLDNILQFELYPNPCKGIFKIKTSDHSPFGIEILDVQGRRLYLEDNFKENEFTDPGLKPGCYYIVLRDEGKIGVRKLVVE